VHPHFSATMARGAAWVSFLLLACIASTGSTYEVLHNFNYGEQYQIGPPGGPLLLNDGALYGVATSGGTGCDHFGCGVVFSLSPKRDNYRRFSVLYEFRGGSDGSYPWGGLVRAPSGELYGTLAGSIGLDVAGIFMLSPTHGDWGNTVLYSEVAGPGLLRDGSGNLYGEMGRGQYKYGAIAELSPGSEGWTYTPLYSFCVFQCGYSPSAPPIWDGKGNLFGTTTDGGIAQPACWTSFGCGVIFEMTPSGNGTWAYHILHRFASFPRDGQSPSGGLVMDASGNLYGVTGGLGGAYKNGTVFKFTPSGGGKWKQTLLYDFPNCANGCYPDGTLALDQAGNLYGAADGGVADCGGYTCGVIFKLTPQKSGKWTYSVVHKFTGEDGAFPWGVVVDDKGNLFGTTENGGTNNSGVAFEITP